MSYRVNLHPLAQADYDDIYGYISARSTEGACSWDSALDGAIASLKANPLAYQCIPDKVVARNAYRQIMFKTKHGNRYRAVFAVEGDLVTILRIRGQGQRLMVDDDLPKRLDG